MNHYYRQQALRRRADELFENQWLKAQLKRWLARLTNQSRDLPFLGNVEQTRHIDAIRPLDTLPIRVQAIKGTAGRIGRFDVDFHPVMRRSKTRWTSVAVAMMDSSVVLPPIEVVQVEDIYYIVDGHHRVSVACALDNLFIDADVTLWDTHLITAGNDTESQNA